MKIQKYGSSRTFVEQPGSAAILAAGGAGWPRSQGPAPQGKLKNQ